MTFSTVDEPRTAYGADALAARVAWLDQFDPSLAPAPELDDAAAVVAQVRAWLDAVGVRVAGARRRFEEAAARSSDKEPSPQPTTKAVPVPRPVGAGPGHASGREVRRRREAASGGELSGLFTNALASGLVSLDHVAALGRVRNTAELVACERELLAAAAARSADEFARWLRDWDDVVDRAKGIAIDDQRRDRRSLSFFEGELAMGGIRVLLDPFAYSLVRDAIFRMSDELWRHSGDRNATPAQRYADALVELIARGAGIRAAAAATPPPEASTTPAPPGAPAPPRESDDLSPKRAARPTMLVFINEATLYGRLDHAGIATTVDGTRISAAEARRLACTADLLPVVLGGDGAVLDIGRAARHASAAQWKALLARDGACVVAGCHAAPSWCDAHHCVQWEVGGHTALDNLCLLCAHHHRMLHRNGWTARVTGGRVALIDTDGQPIPTRCRTGPNPDQRARATSTRQPAQAPSTRQPAQAASTRERCGPDADTAVSA